MKTLLALFVLCAAGVSAFKLMTYQIHFGLDTNNVANLSWTAAVINEQQATMCAIQGKSLCPRAGAAGLQLRHGRHGAAR